MRKLIFAALALAAIAGAQVSSVPTQGGSTTPVNTAIIAQKFFGTAAPGSVATNLPGDLFTDTTGHKEYVCNAPAGTAAPACTSVTAAGWLLINGSGSTTIANTTSVLKGDNAGNGIAATPGTDFINTAVGAPAGTCIPTQYIASGTIPQYSLVVVSGATVQVTGTAGGPAFGVAQSAVTNGQSVGICDTGTSNVLMDATATAGNIAGTSTTTAGQAKDTLQTSRNNVGEQLGVIGGILTGCTGSPCTAVVALEGRNRAGRQILQAYLPTTTVAQKFFGTAAPGSVATNLPGDLFTDTTGHNEYVCGAPAGTAAPACTSVTAGGWLLINGGGSAPPTTANFLSGTSGVLTDSGESKATINPAATLPSGVTSIMIGNWPMTTCAGAAIASVVGTTVPDCPVGAYAGGTNNGTLATHGGSGFPTPSLSGLAFAAANKQTVDLTTGSMTGLKTMMIWADMTPQSQVTSSYVPILGTMSTSGNGAALILKDLSNGTTGPNQFQSFGTAQMSGTIGTIYDYCTGVCAAEWDLHLSSDTPNSDRFFFNGVAALTNGSASLSNGSWSTGSGVVMGFGGNVQAGTLAASYYQGTIYYAIALNGTPTTQQRGQLNAYVQAILAQRGVIIGPGQISTTGNILHCFGDSITMGTGALVNYCQNSVSTTLATTVASGVTTITATSGTGLTPKMALVLDAGLATQETVTTASGYTAGSTTVTLAAATTQPHYAGAGGSIVAPFQALDTTQGAWTYSQRGRPAMTALQGISAVPGLVQSVTSSQAGKQVAVIFLSTNGPFTGSASPATDMANIRTIHRLYHAAGWKTVDVGMLSRNIATSGGVVSVASVPITTPGACSVNPTFTITGGAGSGATLTGVFVGGVLKQLNVTAGGTGFTSTPTVNVIGGTCTTFPVPGTPVLSGTLNAQCSSTSSAVAYGSGILQCSADSAAQAVSQLHGQYWSDYADAFVDVLQIPAFALGQAATNAAICYGLACYADTVHPSVAGHQILTPYIQAGIERALGRSTRDDGIQFPPTNTAASYTIPNSLFQVFSDPTAASQTLTLPTAIAATGARYCVRNQQTAGANTVTAQTTGSQTIDGGGTSALVANNSNVCWTSNGSNWLTR
jgi:hypothetical protein